MHVPFNNRPVLFTVRSPRAFQYGLISGWRFCLLSLHPCWQRVITAEQTRSFSCAFWYSLHLSLLALHLSCAFCYIGDTRHLLQHLPLVLCNGFFWDVGGAASLFSACFLLRTVSRINCLHRSGVQWRLSFEFLLLLSYCFSLADFFLSLFKSQLRIKLESFGKG